jgi:fructokinase/2-dehydro-3-deoxygluconokinase
VSVVVVGDANVDLELRLPEPGSGAVHANPDPRLFGGGSAANTAAALARLGVSCRFVGAVGDDGYGRFATASLEEAGVDVGGVVATRRAPTVMVLVVVPPDGDRLIYVWPPTGGAHADLDPETATAGAADADWLHVSGICLRVSPAREAVLAAMEQAQSAGVPVSFDLNLRLENWGWEAAFRDVAMAAVERADVVVGAATDEIAALAGVTDPVEAALTLSGDERLVIARRGASGAIGCSSDGVVSVPGFEVAVVDTVGAGDAFNAGFIAARLRGAGVGDSLRWGNAVAALTIARHGARSTPSSSEVQGLLAR